MSSKLFNITEIIDRVGQIVGNSKQVVIGVELGIEKERASNQVRVWIDRNTIPLDKLYAFAEKWDVNFLWLLTGEGFRWRRDQYDRTRHLTEETFEKLGDPLRHIIMTANSSSKELFYEVLREEVAKYDQEINGTKVAKKRKSGVRKRRG